MEKSPSRNKDWSLTQESFDLLLTWLGSDRETSAQKYEQIRTRLIKLFSCRGCPESEDLADQCINRVARRLSEVIDTYEGDPALYFYGVARHIHQEYLRKRPVPSPDPLPSPDPEDTDEEYECLTLCLDGISRENRDLVLEYYQDEKKAKIDHRKQMALKLGIAVNALRIRAYRIRAALQECVQTCLTSQRMKGFGLPKHY